MELAISIFIGMILSGSLYSIIMIYIFVKKEEIIKNHMKENNLFYKEIIIKTVGVGCFMFMISWIGFIYLMILLISNTKINIKEG